MNFSLVLAIVLIAVILPWLCRRIFILPPQKEMQWLEPTISATEEEPSQQSHNHYYDSHAIDMMKSPSSLHLTAQPIAKKIKQKDLLSDNQFQMLYVMAYKDNYFVGYDLLQALQNAGLEYGTRQIFHYYSDEDNSEVPLFSVTSATEPGTFDLQEMGSYAIPGLILFMDTRKINDVDAAYDLMTQTAQQLADELQGKVVIHDY